MNNSIHSPANLKPEDYEVIDYLDNQRPRYMGGDINFYKAEVKRWEAEIARYFPHWKDACNHPSHNIHRCHHCGNGTVRWLAVCEHTPTKELLIFGSECVFKLDFKDRASLVLAQIKARAEQGHARMKAYKARCEFLDARPDLKALIESKQIENEVHRNNTFAHDLLAKFDRYGELSESQLTWLFKTLQRDIDTAARKATEAETKARLIAEGVKAPVGRVAVVGQIVHTKFVENGFGGAVKMLVVLDNGTKVWSTIPSSAANGALDHKTLKGHRIEFTATFELSKDDCTFSFGKRPSKARVLSAPQAEEIAPEGTTYNESNSRMGGFGGDQ